ncbi:TPA: hypothetical protein ACX3IV_004809 [Vibrio parahaemolyticus]|nr:hypothetical protein [Vibrio parahaemolyticus]
MKAPKVLFAYCKELGRSLSISEARAEYFAIDQEKRKRFSFSCSDQSCGVLNITVLFMVVVVWSSAMGVAFCFSSLINVTTNQSQYT